MITDEQSQNQTWEATVSHVEHATRTVVVTIPGVSGTRKVRVPKKWT